jgi:hypothetical protein
VQRIGSYRNTFVSGVPTFEEWRLYWGRARPAGVRARCLSCIELERRLLSRHIIARREAENGKTQAGSIFLAGFADRVRRQRVRMDSG